MLITFISPKENVRPMAMSRRMEPRLNALNPSESQIDKLSTSPFSVISQTRGSPCQSRGRRVLSPGLLLLLFHELGAPAVGLQVGVRLNRRRRGRDLVDQAVRAHLAD